MIESIEHGSMLSRDRSASDDDSMYSPLLPREMNLNSLHHNKPPTMGVSRSEVLIQSFVPSIAVITSKQRPRKILIKGSHGNEHTFLLKGHEDLRQDERVMQLFGLTNALLANHRDTSKRDLSIRRYAVIPLSPNCGIIGWVPHCDTLHQLIREFREQRKVRLSIEHMLMQQMAPDYDHCTLMQKVEVFKYALANTDGLDLQKVLWFKSKNSEVWLNRRTNFTRSLAVMSMVGYILGLGDRHPSNLMLDRVSGKIIHIDFGDCFEVAMQRDKYPEKIPFRLTRMLVNAMEVSGIEGNYRSVCEVVLMVLREQRDSVMAMLEAFVHDPLINWGLIATKQKNTKKNTKNTESSTETTTSSGNSRGSKDNNNSSSNALSSLSKKVSTGRTGLSSLGPLDEDGVAEEAPNNSNSTSSGVVPVIPISGSGMKRSKRASAKLSLQGGIKMPTVHDAVAKGDEKLALSLSSSGLAQSYRGGGGGGGGGNGRSRLNHQGSQNVSNAMPSNGSKNSIGLNGLKGVKRTGSGSVHSGETTAPPTGMLNQKAISVTTRVRDKLTGRDFGNDVPLDARTQVNKLILQATSHENLSQCYIGWCPFW